MSEQRRRLVLLLGWFWLLMVLGGAHRVFQTNAGSLAVHLLLVAAPLFWASARKSTPFRFMVFGIGVMAMLNLISAGSLFAWDVPMATIQLLGAAITAYASFRHAEAWGETRVLLSELARLSLPHRYPDLAAAGPNMEREIRRARRYDRPLSVISMRTPECWEMPELEEVVRQHLAQQFAQSRIAEILRKETKTTDIVSFVDGRFVLMLPETNRDEANQLIQRLRKRVQEILKVDITAGLASFPNEEITIFGLMETSSMDVLPDDFETTASQEADILMEAV